MYLFRTVIHTVIKLYILYIVSRSLRKLFWFENRVREPFQRTIDVSLMISLVVRRGTIMIYLSVTRCCRTYVSAVRKAATQILRDRRALGSNATDLRPPIDQLFATVRDYYFFRAVHTAASVDIIFRAAVRHPVLRPERLIVPGSYCFFFFCK